MSSMESNGIDDQPIWVPPRMAPTPGDDFFDGLERETFVLTEDSNGSRHDPRDRYDAAGRRRRVVESDGRGSLVSWSDLQDRAPGRTRAGWKASAAVVALDDGPWWWGRLMTPTHAALRVGMRLHMRMGRPGHEDSDEPAIAVPYWVPEQHG